MICVGQFDTGYLHRFWSQVDEMAPITVPGSGQNSEITRHAGSYLCQQPRGSRAGLWPGRRHLS
ncbi:MAG TPA: hypothetical protein VMU34_20380 [Mycobacterium sp.]|nr:hypothetical protein [Mycobacterium sp.]